MLLIGIPAVYPWIQHAFILIWRRRLNKSLGRKQAAKNGRQQNTADDRTRDSSHKQWEIWNRPSSSIFGGGD